MAAAEQTRPHRQGPRHQKRREGRRQEGRFRVPPATVRLREADHDAAGGRPVQDPRPEILLRRRVPREQTDGIHRRLDLLEPGRAGLAPVQMVPHERVGLVVQLLVEVRREQFLHDAAVGRVVVRSREVVHVISASRTSRRARLSCDLTVPSATPISSAISRYR